MWSRPEVDGPGMSYWWSVCHDCPRRRSFGESRLGEPGAGGHVLDGALLLAALDLAEHQGATGHWRGLLWTGTAAAERGPEPAEMGVCAEHPAYVIPQLGGAWTWLPYLEPRDCALMSRTFDMHGDGLTFVRGYPVAIPAWMDSRHARKPITARARRDDHTQVCRPCVCMTHGPKVHGHMPRDAGSSSGR